MNKETFKRLKPGDRVYYRKRWVTVEKWLEPGYMIQYTNGQNTKIVDPWLGKMAVIHPD